MTNPVSAVVDYLIDLFGPSPDPQDVRAFVGNPVQAASTATGQAVTSAQLQTAYTAVAPVSAAYGDGDPIEGMQRAVANHNGLAFLPQTEALSNNDTLSHNDTRLLSPETNIDKSVDIEFGDITFGDKNTASDGSVINTGNAGDIDNTNVDGDGNVVGDDNDNNNTGDIDTGNNSPVVIGEDNDVDVEDNDVNVDNSGAGDGVIVNQGGGTVIEDVDASGGDGGDGGGLLGGGGGGGGGGGIIVDNSTTNNVDGNQTTVGDIDGDVSGGISGGVNTEDNSVDNSVDNSGQDNSVDNSQTDNSVDNSQTVDVDVDAGIF